MSFEHDAFISYTHLDNEPLLPTESDGWVTIFEQALTQLLSQFEGRKVKVWRDAKLKKNDVFSDEILGKLANAAVLISVLSPRYLQSEWCEREITRFYESAKEKYGVVTGNKCRIIKVIKTPMAKDANLPSPVGDVLQQMLGYEFFDDDKPDTLVMFDPAFGDQPRQKFLARVLEVVRDVKEVLDKLAGVLPATTGKPAVYLAECTRDRREARGTIEAELKRLGYTVLPDRELPQQDETAFVEEVDRLLARCALSVHLVGIGRGAVPEGTDKSVVMLQNEAAVRASRAGKLKRVISLPADTTGAAPAQQEYIDQLHRNADLQFGADLITGGIEELKTAIRSALEAIETKSDVAAKPSEKLVYLLCDPRDRKATVPLVKSLRDRGANVELTVFTGDAAEVRKANEELMMSADAIVLFYGMGDDAWKYHQQNEMKKVRGARREKPPLMYTYLAGPAGDDKQFVADTEKNVIDGREAFAEESLKPLASALGL